MRGYYRKEHRSYGEEAAPAVLPYASLGLGVAGFGVTIADADNFSSICSAPVYFEHPLSKFLYPYQVVNKYLLIWAFHPSLLWENPQEPSGWQKFWFQLRYKRNGYDLKDIRIIKLVHASSTMIYSKFHIEWHPHVDDLLDTFAEVSYAIDGTWDPAGFGFYSITAPSHLTVTSNGNIEFNISSELFTVQSGGVHDRITI
jgi:hypothetical protein